MCGIAGIYSRAIPGSVKHEKLLMMTHALHHRGPDDASIYADSTIGLASTRLGIVDRSSQHRLSWDDKNRCLLAFNGEIYNYKELRQQYSTIKWFTKTDTEVVARLVGLKSEHALDQLHGDFAIAFWDSVNNSGFIARDRLGVKPLYYVFISGGIAFASEIRPLLIAFPEVNSISPAAISEYLTYRFVSGSNTAYTDIKKLPAGHWLPLGRDIRDKPTCYWDIQFGKELRHVEPKTVVHARSLIENAVCNRLSDEVECGALLSGGLDSSLLTAIAAMNQTKSLQTFSVVYLDNPNDMESSEHVASRLVSEMYSTDHYELSISAQDFRDATDSTINHLGDLIANPTSVLRAILCKAASDHVRVLISGEGADELFAGYTLYSELIASGNSYDGIGRLLTNPQKDWLISSNFVSSILSDRLPTFTRTVPKNADQLHKMLYADCKYWLADDLLRTTDKTAMMSSIEVRVPFLDHLIVEFAFSLSSQTKLSSPLTKAFLREVAVPYLPDSIINGPKRGFPLPLGEWLRGSLKTWTSEIILDGLFQRDFFRRQSLTHLMSRYFSEAPNRHADHVIWSLIVLELFLRQNKALQY